jgi:uncharacterized protein YwgA
MEDINRLSVLLALIKEAGGKIQGRKKLQKLTYLLQFNNVQNIQYDFDFYNYGVFSHLLAHDLMSAVVLGFVKEDKKTGSFYPYYEITLNDQKLIPFPLDNLNLNQENKALFDKTSSFLEVLSTIVYLDKNGYKGTDLTKKLRDLKGHLKIEFDIAFSYAEKVYKIPNPITAN